MMQDIFGRFSAFIFYCSAFNYSESVLSEQRKQARKNTDTKKSYVYIYRMLSIDPEMQLLTMGNPPLQQKTVHL